MDIFAPGPWEFIVSGAEAGERFASPKCQSRTGDTRIRVRGRPSDAALERYIRLGELEHEVDSKRAFTNFIAVYAKNVISLVGDTPSTRLSAPDVRQCNAKLRRLENRDLLTDFVIELNRLTAIRHARSRHSSSHTGLRISPDCSNVTADFDAGTL
ncbi:MAG: hypothetical protein ACE5GO_09020 [Anaerolineales bacterium]